MNSYIRFNDLAKAVTTFDERYRLFKKTFAIKRKISLNALAIIIYLHDESAQMGGVAKHGVMSSAAATGSIDRLEKINLVRRMDVEGDRRKVKPELTEQGMELAERFYTELRRELKMRTALFQLIKNICDCHSTIDPVLTS